MRYIVVKANRGVILAAMTMLCVGMLFFMNLPAKIVETAASGKKHPIFSVDTTEKKVSLGINCAWDNADIPVLIAILEKYDIKASFFVSGSWCKKYPESVLALYQAGHEIGSHSNTHANLTTLGKEGIQQEIRLCNQKIENITGNPVKLFRAPSGAYNNLVVETILEEGMEPIQWDCDSIDYEDPTPAQMKERILKGLKPGSITLFHSGAKNTPAALPGIIEAIKAKGYEFVTVSELIYPPPYTIDHEGRQHKT